ncbi:MAG: HEAT repeat domain-containing protein [Verrucomicrobia bacterium]|jgi:HEAT repeat protein|nr:HEAT repeat domain-containing protein [Verrucomicrobiota bacterium]
MSATESPTAERFQQAFAHLENYGPGSGRGALQPIDDAVAAAARDETLRAGLEKRLVALLRGKAPAVAKDYACGKLAILGGPAAVPALAELLTTETLAHAATNALQLMPCPEAGAALRASLEKLSGLPLAGALTALGMRRDPTAATQLAAFLGHADPVVAAAAVAALGEIGTPATGATLREFLPKAPAALRSALADACLACAERLKAAGDLVAGRSLLDALLEASPPEHVRAAARRIAS